MLNQSCTEMFYTIFSKRCKRGQASHSESQTLWEDQRSLSCSWGFWSLVFLCVVVCHCVSLCGGVCFWSTESQTQVHRWPMHSAHDPHAACKGLLDELVPSVDTELAQLCCPGAGHLVKDKRSTCTEGTGWVGLRTSRQSIWPDVIWAACIEGKCFMVPDVSW